MINLRKRMAGRRSRSMLMPAVLFLFCALISAAGSSAVAADEARRIDGLDFDELVVLGDIEVEVSQGDEAQLQLRGPSQLLELQPFTVDGRALVLGSNNGRRNESFDGLQYRVVMPVLRELSVKGSADVYVKAFEPYGGREHGATSVSLSGSGDIKLFGIKGGELELSIKGPGDIKVVSIDVAKFEGVVAGNGDLFIQTLRADYAEFSVTGSGDVAVTGKSFAKKLNVSVIGSGRAGLEPLDCDAADVNILGSGEIVMGNIMQYLSASAIGSGDASYRGDPEVESVQLGSGEVSRRD